MGIFDKLFKKNKPSEIEQENLLPLDFPQFIYYPDPFASKSFVKSKTACPVCSKKNGYEYCGNFYSVDDVEHICPWCISSGRAAKKHDGTFHDFQLEEENIEEAKFKELMERTPGFDSWQPGIWPCHCDEICAFMGHVGWKEIQELGLAKELKEDFFANIDKTSYDKEFWSDAVEGVLDKHGSPTGYLFKCLKCGKYRLTVDFD